MAQVDGSSAGTGGGAKVHPHARGAPSPDIPLASVSCQFTDTGLERLFRVTDPECDAASFAALMLATAVLCGVTAAVSFYVHNVVDSLLMAAAALFLLWVLLRWCLHRLAWRSVMRTRGDAAAAVSPLQAARSNQAVARDYLREQVTCLQRLTVAWLDASLCTAVMATATLWAFLRAPDLGSGDAGWVPTLPPTPSGTRLYGVPVVAVLPVALGLDYVSVTASQLLWCVCVCKCDCVACVACVACMCREVHMGVGVGTVGCVIPHRASSACARVAPRRLAVYVVCNFAWLWDRHASLVYGGVMWASVLIIGVQVSA